MCIIFDIPNTPKSQIKGSSLVGRKVASIGIFSYTNLFKFMCILLLFVFTMSVSTEIDSGVFISLSVEQFDLLLFTVDIHGNSFDSQ